MASLNVICILRCLLSFVSIRNAAAGDEERLKKLGAQLRAEECGAYPKCEGFDGLCCPTAEGVMLDCCGLPKAGFFVATPKLTLDGVKVAMAAAEAKAKENNWHVAIAICDAGGIPLMMVRNGDGHSGEEAMGKCQTAALFQVDTATLESSTNVQMGKARTALLSTPWYMMAGGLPIWKDGVCVGSVGVSGVKPVFGSQVAKAAVDALSSGGQMSLAAPAASEFGSVAEANDTAATLATGQVWMMAACACSIVGAFFFYLGRWNVRQRSGRDALMSNC